LDTLDPTQRFSSRVAYYHRYRPRYPQAILPYLETTIGLRADAVVADVGSGTGLLAERFLQYGNTVFAVEPNGDMRAVAEDVLGDFERFHSVVGTAEATTLANESVDLISAGQAFHWFNTEEARREFRRILRVGGWVTLIYNSWNVPHSPIAPAYRELISRYGIDYKRVSCQRRIGSDMKQFFGGEEPREARFENPQRYDFEALRGRVLSSSYAPLPEHEQYEPLVDGLHDMFDSYAVDGVLTFPYQTTVYVGRPGP
jgi:SAM-dependent methyltransferase